MSNHSLNYKFSLPTLRRPRQLFSATRWMGLSLVVGVAIGVVSLVFVVLLNWLIEDLARHFFAATSAAEPAGEISLAALLYDMKISQRWPILFIPTLGGLLTGYIVYKWAPDAAGHGTDAMIRAFHHHQARIPLKVPFIKMIASIVTIGTGGSAGREGPIVQIGAGFATWLSDLLKLSAQERRILMLCGVAAGIGAVFRAPLGGAVFAVSVLYRSEEFEYEALMPAFLSSIIAYSVYCSLSPQGWGSIFSIPDPFNLIFNRPVELIFYALVGIILALIAPLYIRFFYWMSDRFANMKIHPMYRPAIGGLCLGVISVFWPVGLGGGYEWVQRAINSGSYIASGIEPLYPMSISFLLALAATKIITCSLTIGSGGSGGVFAPTLVIGGCLGGAMGLIGHNIAPNVIANPEAYVLLGMAGFFAGVANVPMATLIMVLQMTVGYSLLVPLMTVCAITYFAKSSKYTIYSEQLHSRLDSPAHLGDFIIDVLERMRVGDVVKTDAPVEAINESATFHQVLDLTTESIHTTFPVIGKDGKMRGILSYALIRPHLYNTDLNELLIATDIMVQVAPLSLDDTLATALRRHLEEDLEELPVVDSKDPNHVVSLISRRDIISAYHREMKKPH